MAMTGIRRKALIDQCLTEAVIGVTRRGTHAKLAETRTWIEQGEWTGNTVGSFATWVHFGCSRGWVARDLDFESVAQSLRDSGRHASVRLNAGVRCVWVVWGRREEPVTAKGDSSSIPVWPNALSLVREANEYLVEVVCGSSHRFDSLAEATKCVLELTKRMQ